MGEGTENIMHHFEPKIIWDFHLGSLDLSVTDYIIWLWIALFVVFLLMFFASRRISLIPKRGQNINEVLIEFVKNNLIIDIMGKEGLPWLSFIATLFLYILTCNLLGLIPNSKTPTVLTGTTASWAIIVFITYHVVGIQRHGIKYFGSFVPSGVPKVMAPFMLVIEIVSHLARPFSLAVRLFANMLAGHTVLAIFTAMAISATWWLKIIPFAGVLVMLLFEIFVALIQAYIFAVLAAIYLAGAIHIEH